MVVKQVRFESIRHPDPSPYEKLNAWRQHAQARTGGEIASALVRLNEVGELKYLVSQREGR